MSKTPLPPKTMEYLRMARQEALSAAALTLITLLLLTAPWIARHALHWSVDDSVALVAVVCLPSLAVGALAIGLLCDAVDDYNLYRRSIDKLHWEKFQQEQEGKPEKSVVTAARKRKLLSLVHGETYPYEWAVYKGETPLKRFIDKTEALDHFTKLAEEQI